MAVDTIPLRTAAPAGIALNATVKYNPHLWGPDELRSIFVVRTRELQGLLERLRATPDASVPQHVLVTGSRGMGKTTLLRRLALAVEDDPELSKRWVPVTFPEEQYTVSTLAELWRNVLDALADTLERQGASTDELARLDAEIRRIGELPADARESAALESLADWIRSHDRRLLLLIDSTDLLLSNLAGTAEPGATKAAKGKKAGPGARAAKVDGGATPLWRLRGTLAHDPGIFWLGASYQSLETDHAYQDAFWDFFELVELRPLQVAEMREAMLALARTFGAGRGLTGEDAEQEMARNLDARPERLKALRAITGGNPRTTVMLYELFAAGGVDDVHSDLRRLLDTMTPLYKARMEALSDQARKLLAHLMEHWAPISARDLGQVSGIATNTVSGQLGRLEAEGLVEKAALAGSKRAGYQASERLFNVWYLMRYASRRLRQRLTWLVEFMRLWYSSDELTDLARQRAGQHGQGRLCRGEQLEFSRALSFALPDGHADHYRLDWAVFRAARRTADRTRADLGELFELDGEDREFTTAEDYLTRFEALDARLALCPHLTDDTRGPWIEAVKSSLSLTLPEKERIADAAKALTEPEYRDRLRALQDERDRWEQDHGAAAVGVVRDAVLAGHFFPDCPVSKLAHHQIIGCFGEDFRAIALALRLGVRKHHDTWCEKVARHALDLDPKHTRPWNSLGNLLSEQPGRAEEAEAAYRRAAELDPMDAWPWFNLGLLLSEQPSRGGDVEAAYRRAAELDPTDPDPVVKQANLLAAQGQHSEASTAYRQVVTLAQAADGQDAGTERLPVNRGFGHAHLLLQAHLWLGNRDLALHAL
ncbi:MAG TPA: AAA family ATPase, partial [Lamprocystis sp. (in: g-proteobacteria)]|nr:AAA family ATPase [Lamprocystis sp. (in: g-proteobacteria)]